MSRRRPVLQLLGYPEGSRVLIVNADDFGSCHANNAAILDAITGGIVSSTTLMTPCPWAPEALLMLRSHPEIAFGVHLTLISEFGGYRWGSLSPRDQVTSLLDDDGYFCGLEASKELMERAKIDEVEREFRAQIDRVLDFGLHPTHLDWHCLLEGGRDDILHLTVRLAREYGVAMRVHRTTTSALLMQQGLPAPEHPPDDTGFDADARAERYSASLRALPAGLSEWAVHPGLGNDESRALEPDTWKTRRADYEFVTSRDAKDLIGAEGIRLISYRELQPFWRGVGK